MAKFDRGQILIGGAPCAELTDGEYEISNGSQPVVGMGGYLGTTDGALIGMIRANRVVPRGNFSTGQQIADAVMKQKEISIMAISGGEKVIVTAVPNSYRRAFGVSATSVEGVQLSGKVERDTI